MFASTAIRQADASTVSGNCGKQRGGIMAKFQRELLPLSRNFYGREIGSLTRPNRKGWALGRCPFHSSRSGKSFGVNLDSGAFFCFGCGAKGADPVAFLMQRDNTDFKTAAKS